LRSDSTTKIFWSGASSERTRSIANPAATASATSWRSPVASTMRSIPSPRSASSSCSVPARSRSDSISTPASLPSTATAVASAPAGRSRGSIAAAAAPTVRAM